MKKMMAALTLSTTLGCFPFPVHAGNGQELLTSCQWAVTQETPQPSEQNAFIAMNFGLCLGAIDAVVDTVVMVGQITKNPLLCMGKGIPGGQAVITVMNYLSRHPENLDMRQESVVFMAMRESYPCPAAR